MHADEAEIDEDLVRRLVASQFPQWARLPVESFASSGTVNAIYRLGHDMYVRLPRVHRWARDLHKESRWLPELAPHLPLRVPEPLGLGTPADDYPFHWGVYRWLAGDTWAVERTADPLRAATALAHFVAALHGMDPTGGPPSGRDKPLVMRDPETRAAIASLHGIIDTDAATAAWDSTLRQASWHGSPVWTHGDLLPSNLLVAGGRLVAVIDFGCAGVGDPACDLVAAWSLFAAEARNVYRRVLDVDDAAWTRGRGWALSIALLIIPYYPETNPTFVTMAKRIVDEVLADYRQTG